MRLRIQTINFDDDGSIQINWIDEHEIKPEGGVAHQTWITEEGLTSHDQLKYWNQEVRESVYELLEWWFKVQKGTA